MKIQWILLGVVLLMGTFTKAQSTELANWKGPSQYRAAEPKIAELISDLEGDPLQDVKKRKMSNYILTWLVGVPYLRINIQDELYLKIQNDPTYKYGDFLANGLLFGEGLYYIENQGRRDKVAAYRRGVYYTINMYEKIKAYDNSVKCKTIENFIKLRDKNQLDLFLRIQRAEK